MKDYRDYTLSELEVLNEYVNDVKILRDERLSFSYENRAAFFNESVWGNDTDEFKSTYSEMMKETKEYLDQTVNRVEPKDLVEMLDLEIIPTDELKSFWVKPPFKYCFVLRNTNFAHNVPFYFENHTGIICPFDDSADILFRKGEVRRADNFCKNDILKGFDASCIQSTTDCFYNSLPLKRDFMELVFNKGYIMFGGNPNNILYSTNMIF